MTPVVRGLHLAERAEVDPVTRNLTIFNSFRILRQRRLPGLVDSFYLVARMAGGLGNVQLLAQMSRLDTFAEVYRSWVTVNFPDRLQDVIFKLRVEQCLIRDAGAYEVALWAGDVLLAQTPFTIRGPSEEAR